MMARPASCSTNPPIVEFHPRGPPSFIPFDQTSPQAHFGLVLEGTRVTTDDPADGTPIEASSSWAKTAPWERRARSATAASR